MATTISTFATDLLKAIGAPATSANIQSIEDWAAREGGGGANNPLNTTLVTAGSTGAINNAGVQNYANAGDGVTATAQTLGGYPAIVAALRSGGGIAGSTSSAVASELSEWSGGGYTSVSGAGEPGSTAVSSGSAASTAQQAELTSFTPSEATILEGPTGIIQWIAGELAGQVTGAAGSAQSIEGMWKSLSAIATEFEAVLTGIEWLFVPSHWVRIIAFWFGVGTGIPGLSRLSRAGTGDASLAIGILLTTLSAVCFFVAFHNLPADVESFSDLLQWLSDGIRRGVPKPVTV